MHVPVVAVILPVGILFFTTGLIVNLIQMICYCLVRPISKNLYRRIIRVALELLWLELVWLFDWWAGIKRSGCLGSALAVMKKSSKFLPVIGWSMWFAEYLFLERSWAKDESTIKLGIQRLRDYPLPFWLALFVEGTRFTQAKLLAAQEYATSTGLPVPRNVLIPRTKGFVSAVNNMRSFVPAVYDITIAIPKNSPPPTMLRIFKGQPSAVQVHIKRHLMNELPEKDEDVAQWCRDVFVAKDALLDKHKCDDKFSDQECHDAGKPIKSLLVVISWVSLLFVGFVKFILYFPLPTSWKGFAFSIVCFGVVTILMQILIRFTQSEHSTPAAKVVPIKTNKAQQSQAEARNNKQD
ncbi:1-acyl-sn-glycerol-3-phosphate acyltransferase 2 [Stylosanthes scabra]|uniref:1-acylglycerol-3-phosphate O-acyltransferase n=1 Tax=Stylosanthes scabra TaxID=79078 RepID=A0ABU6Z1R6_9FABA|nr:1-acyl-sn-glycerol-3-phosphate acyltransferase 2 [Stylosanthes scabra]